MASFYEWQLVTLVLACVIFLLLQQRVFKRADRSGSPDSVSSQTNAPSKDSASKLTRQYLWVYALVMGADWLQGPYIYSVYREQHDLPERLVALLFVLGFLTAGVSAPAVGIWADQYGRKRLCMTFCITYALTCAFIQLSSLPTLFVGRFLGGFSTAILFSCFESWLVSSAHNLSLSSHDLSTILGYATLVNSIAAVLAGVVSNKLVEYTATFSSPFVASGVLLLLAFGLMWSSWEENYGGARTLAQDVFNTQRLSEAWSVVCADKRLFVLGFIQTCFEGSMYLFVFLWVPFLQEAAAPNSALPLGYIFSSFMLSMTLGALVYNSIISLSHSNPATDGSTSHDPTVTLHAKLSSVVCTASALAFAISVSSADEHWRFWAFCAFEACVGVYYPVQGMLRGKLVPDEHRATLSSLFRVPLNAFVVVSLMTGVASARHFVLSTCALLLLLTALVTAVAFLEPARQVGRLLEANAPVPRGRIIMETSWASLGTRPWARRLPMAKSMGYSNDDLHVVGLTEYITLMAGSAPAQSGSVLLRIDDTSPRLQYSQEWEQSGADEDYLATSHVSHSTGSSVKFSFNGTFVTVYGSVGTDGSSSSYVLDGAPPITSNVQSVPSPQYNWPFFYPDAQLEPGLHELVITVTSGTYSLDYIEYTSLADEENVGDASRLPASSSSPSPSPTSRLSSPGLSSSTSSARGIPSGAIAGIAIAAVSVLLAVVVAFFCIRRRRSARKVRPQSHLPEKGIGVLFDGQPKESEAASRSPFRRLSLSRVYRPTPARSAQSSKTATSSAPTSITQSSAMFTSVIMISPALSMVSEESSLHDSPNRLGA